jgi:plasmid replication initiation protein
MKQAEQPKLPSRNLLYLDNKLAQASYSMNLSEHRLISILLSKTKPTNFRRKLTMKELANLPSEEVKRNLITKIHPTIKVDDVGELLDSVTLHSISVKEYAEFCSIRVDNARTELLEASDNLFNRYIHLKDSTNGKFIKFRWVSSISFDPETDLVGLRWSIDLLPYITDLKDYFTKLKLGKLLELQSIYSWKLYTVICSRRGENSYKSGVTFTLEELLFMLDVPDSYKEFKHFNNLLLKKAIIELRNKLKMNNLEVKFVKSGRKIVKLVFFGFTTGEEDEKK